MLFRKQQNFLKNCAVPDEHVTYCEIPETRYRGSSFGTVDPQDLLGNPQDQLLFGEAQRQEVIDGSVAHNSIGATSFNCRNGAASASFVSYSPRNYCMAEPGGVSDLEA